MFPIGAILAGDPFGKYQKSQKDAAVQAQLDQEQQAQALRGKLLQQLLIPGGQQMPLPGSPTSPVAPMGGAGAPLGGGFAPPMGGPVNSAAGSASGTAPGFLPGGTQPISPSDFSSDVDNPESPYNRTSVSLGGAVGSPAGGSPQPGGPAGPRSLPPTGTGGAQPGMAPAAAGGQQQGPFTLQNVVQQAQQILGPKADPAVFAKVIDQMVPMMNAQAQQQWHQLSQQLRIRELNVRERRLDQQEGMAPAAEGQREGPGSKSMPTETDIETYRRFGRDENKGRYAFEFNRQTHRAAEERDKRDGITPEMRVKMQMQSRAAEAGMKAAERARMSAEPKALSKALTDQTSMLTAVRGFTKFAEGNGQQLLKYADKIDMTGIPIVEGYLRATRQQLGDPDVANFNQLLNTFRVEVARITAQPRLVGQLTDRAQAEVEKFMHGSISAGQLRAMLPLLSQEFARRHAAIEEEISSIRAQLGALDSTGAPPAMAPAAAPAAAGAAPAATAPDDPWGIR